MPGLPEFPPEFVVPTLKVVHLSLEVHGGVIIPNQVLGFYGLKISIHNCSVNENIFLIRIISNDVYAIFIELSFLILLYVNMHVINKYIIL